MGDSHFWDNGVSNVSAEENCKLNFETLDGYRKSTPLMTIDKALMLMETLKKNRQTVSCEAVRVVDNEEQPIQSFKLNVVEVDGKKIII